jgi:hypothetical protein
MGILRGHLGFKAQEGLEAVDDGEDRGAGSRERRE